MSRHELRGSLVASDHEGNLSAAPWPQPVESWKKSEMGFPIENIAANLRRWGCSTEETESGIAWNTWAGGHSKIDFNQRGVKTLDNIDIVGEVRFTHTFGPELQKILSPEKAAAWNIMGSLSAILLPQTSATYQLVSRISIYKDDDDACNRIYSPFVCTEAYQQPMAIIEAAIGSGSDPQRFGLQDAEAPPPLGESAFLEAREYCRQRGFHANVSSTGLVVEFPAGNGGSSGIEDPTFLCRLRTNERHPCLGRGLLGSLQVSKSFATRQHAVQVVNQLNIWESNAVDMAPFLGAWCLDPQFNAPMFTMFLPNELCVIRPTTVVAWMMHRAWRVSPVLAGFQNEQHQPQ